MSHDIVDAVGFEPTFFAVLLIQILPLPRGAVTRIHLAVDVGVQPTQPKGCLYIYMRRMSDSNRHVVLPTTGSFQDYCLTQLGLILLNLKLQYNYSTCLLALILY